jgi:hypothetical protein
MAIAPLRAKQTTTTTGTGTLALLAAGAGERSFQAALGNAAVITPYVISGTGFFEVGLGSFDGGSPGSLTRATILASSNSGSAVSLPAGTADVFIPFLPGLRGVRTGTGSETATRAWAGEAYTWTGTSAGTLTLPAAAQFPPAIGLPVINAGTALLTIDGDSAETVGGFASVVLRPGQSVELIGRGSAWDALGLATGAPALTVATGTDNTTMTLAMFGNEWVFTGSSAKTFTLLPVAGRPAGVVTRVRNRGTAILTIDGDGAETVNGTASIELYPGQTAELSVRSGAWDAAGHTGQPPIVKTGSGTMSAGVLAVTFATAFPNAVVTVIPYYTGSTAAGTFNGLSTSTPTTTGFTIYTAASYGGGVNWRAEGY